jgi:pyruvate dehydrogenase E1 component
MTDRTSDVDNLETQEWLSALDNVLEKDGTDRAQFLLQSLAERANQAGLSVVGVGQKNYINTIAPSEEPVYPGDLALEKRLHDYIRWNAVAMVVRAGHVDPSLGGHLASYASSAHLYEVGFHHHFHAASAENGGDLLYIQGHVAPGIYSRAFLEGRFDEQHLINFRQENRGHGISSYPHPRSMPDFWQFPTVSMGLGPLQAIYQAKFLKFLQDRNLAKTDNRKVWAFCGDGEMDEPESLGALGIASYAQLDNLVFVVNCNLQRLDGPVRGNGSIVRELEGTFAGAGWNVIKVLWDSAWDPLFAADKSGLLIKRLNECVDGDQQLFRANDGAFLRDNFFGKYPELAALVANYSNEQLHALERGGHDPRKVHAAYVRAQTINNGKPTVILAQTVKGYGIETVSGSNNAHNIKKLDEATLKILRDKLNIPLTDAEVAEVSFCKPDKNSPEMKYLFEHREKLAGFLPARRTECASIKTPAVEELHSILQGTEGREISSNMALVRVVSSWLKDKELKDKIAIVIPDESRTLGLEGLFRQIGIYAPMGQLYKPVDSGQLVYYKEDTKGQILQEGINEAGAFCSWIAAGTSYSNNNVPMIPLYFFYSMFGFQRIADLAWAAGDMRTRGFLIGGLSGRTTLSGEGLQHCDGHSHLLASTIPSCLTYDPTYAYEIAIIMQEGFRRMFENKEDIYYYITMMNENYAHPAMPEGVEQGIIKGLYPFKKAAKAQVQLLGAGAILREVEAAAEMLKADFGIEVNIWGATSINELRRDGLKVQHWNLLHPTETPKQAYVAECLLKEIGPVIVATDYMKLYADQIRQFLPAKTFVSLGTDGFAVSDTRAQLRDRFEVDRRYIVLAALKALADEGSISIDKVQQAIKQYAIDSEKVDPLSL